MLRRQLPACHGNVELHELPRGVVFGGRRELLHELRRGLVPERAQRNRVHQLRGRLLFCQRRIGVHRLRGRFVPDLDRLHGVCLVRYWHVLCRVGALVFQLLGGPLPTKHRHVIMH